LSGFQRVVKLAKLTTLLSGVLTILCAVMIAGLQITSWIRAGVWDTYLLSSVIRALQGDTVYVTASINKTELTIKQAIVDWLLGIPAIVPLLVVTALHLAFYLYLAAVEKEASSH
jgi:hypothetical protein